MVLYAWMQSAKSGQKSLNQGSVSSAKNNAHTQLLDAFYFKLVSVSTE